MGDMQDWRPSKELKKLMADEMDAIKSGELERAKKLHRQANDLMPSSIPKYEYPDEYYQLMHEDMGLDPKDRQRHKEIQSKLNEVFRSVGIEVMDTPEECERIMDQMMQMQDEGDQKRMMELSRDLRVAWLNTGSQAMTSQTNTTTYRLKLWRRLKRGTWFDFTP